ncbi:MAG TPA: RNA pseudouridine synthase [Planctomycetaceae bacterium]|nr:RNA pseudouridine synthase [Planctomycetaceae bacterium]
MSNGADVLQSESVLLPEPTILCEDGPLLAVYKPAGLLTQGVPDGAVRTVEAWAKDYLKQKYAKPGNVYLGIPHRLDRPVSGVMVFAKNSKAAARLAEQFRERTVQKEYLCITEGVPSPTADRLTDWLLKDADKAHVSVAEPESPGARTAELSYEVLQIADTRALVRIQLHTGRMHQIRVQLSSRGWPVVGDHQYGAPCRFPGIDDGDRPHPTVIALHAARLELSHPIRYDRLMLTAPMPATWAQFGFA